MQARYYDPVIGRFYSNDPVGFTGPPHSFNRYAYVANNPYKYIDPDGRELVSAISHNADARALGNGKITIGEFSARQAGRVQASRIALKFSLQGRIALAVLSGLDIVLNESSEELTEEEIQEIHKDCVKDCIEEEVDKYENKEQDAVDRDKIIKEARKRAEKIIEEKQSD